MRIDAECTKKGDWSGIDRGIRRKSKETKRSSTAKERGGADGPSRSRSRMAQQDHDGGITKRGRLSYPGEKNKQSKQDVGKNGPCRKSSLSPR